ncbi:MAG: DUF898 family protein [Lautropia sp.]
MTPSPGAPERLRFSGSGSEYFRIWIVNLLLTLVTLGLYSPWAKVRRLRYFYGNTYLGGAPFDFHGRPAPILVGRVIALVLLFVYANPAIFSWQLSLGTALLIALLLPVLVQRSLRFRLRNTSWRNLRFGFRGTALQAWRATLQPLMVAGALLAALALAAALLGALRSVGVSVGPGLEASGAGVAAPYLGAALMLALVVIALPLMTAAAYCAYRRFAGNHANFGSARFALTLRLANVAKIHFVAALFNGLLLAAVLAVVVVGALGADASRSAGVEQTATWLRAAPAMLVPAAYLGFWATSGYLTSRLQRLVWNNTRLDGHRFACDLSARRFAWLMIRNLLLTILTVGLYRPFAAVARARMQVESVSFLPDGELDAIVASAQPDPRAIGEEVVDALDLDLSF